MSHTAIAAVLARTDLSIGERLVALSLASFANRDHRAWPGNAAAAARAGLGRSRYLEARDQLVARGFIAVESTGRGRGQSTTLIVLFAKFGPWWDGDINAQLVEQVLTSSRSRGPARLLLATLAALAGESGLVENLSTAELCRAAGLADSTYRRARTALLASEEVEVVEDGGGRGRVNRWRVVGSLHRVTAPQPTGRRRRGAPPPGQPPLLCPVRPRSTVDVDRSPVLNGVSARKGPDLNGVSAQKGPVLTGVSGGNPAKTPPETPPPHARARNKSLKPGTTNPPSPPHGGDPRSVTIEESYVTDRGRRRTRSVPVDLAEVRRRLQNPTSVDRSDWQRIRDQLKRATGEDIFAVWLDPIELIAIDEQRLVLAAPSATAAWTSQRYSRLLTAVAAHLKRNLRFATDAERHVLKRCTPSDSIPTTPKEATG